MTNPFDPQTAYDVPKGDSKYLKFEKGQTKFMPMDSAIIGWQYWTNDNKPMRLKEQPDKPAELPNIRQEDDGTYKVSHFWAFPVIDAKDGKVKVLEVTQKTVMSDIRNYATNDEWGNPVQKYTFTVNRTGEKFETKYTTMANPSREIPKDWKDAWDAAKLGGFDITRLFDNGDPFSPEV